MPKNIEKTPRANPDFFIVNVSGARVHSLAPKTSYIGHTISLAETKYSVYQRQELEFCFRLSSDESFAEDEIKLLEENGAKIVSLGNRILRTETAAIVTAGVIMQMLETI